ncbi:MAG: dTMP kinase [Phycisphaerales bacterium]|nr:MAG: dTMP kinase [Phycisphaerales bacterium]
MTRGTAPHQPDDALAASLAGRFLVFEGPDGSGKTTQFRRLARDVRARGQAVVEVREPGGTDVGEKIRKALLEHSDEAMSVRCEMLLYMASRAQLCEQVIGPALERAEAVFADRFVQSTVSYQGHAGGLPLDEIEAVARIATHGTGADLVIVFDVDEPTAAKRLNPLMDRMEAKGAEFHRRVREGYHAQAESDPHMFRVLDARGSEDEVYARLLATLRERFVTGLHASPLGTGRAAP